MLYPNTLFIFHIMFFIFHIIFMLYTITFFILTCACFEQDVEKVEECHEEALRRKEWGGDDRHPFLGL
jgi:hypothetical protein